MSRLLEVELARQRLISAFSPTSAEVVPISNATGRVLADSVKASKDLPPFSNSSMDGFAVQSEDTKLADDDNPVSLQVVADIPAGRQTTIDLGQGQAARIMTGAPLPNGADAVVPVEATDFHERRPGNPVPEFVRVFKPVQRGDYIRRRGEDVRTGDTIIQQGSKLRSQDIGLFAMLGFAEVPVQRMPKVAILSAGDELLPVTEELLPGKIYDSNSYTLISLISKYGGQAENLGIVEDNSEAVKKTLDQAVAKEVDLILSSAGVSVGAFDYVRTVVEEYGKLSFWRVNMRPGKPIVFGQYKNIPFIGLPGNPVSAFVGFEVFVRPAILKMSGLKTSSRNKQIVRLQEPVESDGRESYLRAVISYQDRIWQARLTGHQGSGNLRSLVQANALLLIPSGVKSLPIGSEVEAWILD